MKTALLVGAGRRVSFAERLRKRGYHVLAYELMDTVPIAAVAEIVRGVAWKDAKEHLEAVIDERMPHLTFFLQDEAVAVGAQILRSGVVAPAVTAAETCYDKLKFHDFMDAYFPEIYPTWRNFGDGSVVVKPRFGYGSRGVKVYHSLAEWSVAPRSYDNDEVIQRFIQGTEYTVDAYFDRCGKFVDAAPRVRERVAGGEVISSRMVRDVELRDLVCHVGEKLWMVGPACFQFFRDANGKVWLFEVNARFGGGCILSMEAGFDQLALVERDWLGKPCAYVPNKWNASLAMHRYNQEFFYEA